MKTKTLHKTSSNFLNNQNYILGKTEKKKILSKYFIEKNFYLTIINLNYISNFIYKILKYIYLEILAIITIYTLYLGTLAPRKNLYEYVGVALIIFVLFIAGTTMNNETYSNKITSIYDFFVNEDFLSKNSTNTLHKMINIVIPIGILIYFNISFIPFNFLYIFLLIIIGLIYLIIGIILLVNKETLKLFNKFFLKIGKVIVCLNYINILFTPFILIYLIIYSSFSYINTFLINGSKKYYIIKCSIKTKITEKFKFFINYVAKNKYYTISKKLK